MSRDYTFTERTICYNDNYTVSVPGHVFEAYEMSSYNV